MEIGSEEFTGSNDLTQIIKGRRTKRHRSSSPYKAAAVAATSSSSSGCGAEGRGEEVVLEEYGSVFYPSTTCSDIYESTEEEEDMANCLILLAQGDGPRKVEKIAPNMEKFTTQNFSDFASSAANKAGFYVYECKTCNRSFPSFQALGGHRASHKKTKPTLEEKKPSPSLPLVVASIDDINLDECPIPDLVPLQIATTTNTNSNKVSQGNNNKVNKVHECSICGSEFSSGQALGGHMRRHRANTGNNSQVPALSGIEASPTTNMNDQDRHMIKPRNVLPLDLNLPAPEEDHYHHHHHYHREQHKFEFPSTQQALVFSAPTLVDCHY